MKINAIHLNQGFILREMGGEFHIFYEQDKNAGALVGMPSLNELGIYLWGEINKNRTVEEMINAVMQKDHLDEDEATEDVYEFLAKLIHCDVIQIEKE